jgi:hypothetical protein
MRRYNPLLGFLLTLAAIAGITLLGPPEKSLGPNVRVVYLHGAWVWAGMIAFVAAAAIGLGGLILRREKLHRWSRALGRTGLIFWITYLPISIWAMQTNWNGLFLAEPRWRVALVFAIGGLLLQIGLTLVEEPAWASAANLVYCIALFLALQNTERVLHPPSPILSSDAWRIQLFFGGLLLLTLLAAAQLALWIYRLDKPAAHTQTKVLSQ